MANYYLNEDGSLSTTNKKKKKGKNYLLQADGTIRENVQSSTAKSSLVTSQTKESQKDTYFQKGAFTGNYDWGRDGLMQLGYETVETVASTVADIGTGVAKGAFSTLEGIKDLAYYGVAGASDVLGADEFAKKTRESAQKSDVDKIFGGVQDYLEPYSLLGNKARAIPEGLGNVASILLTGNLGTAAGLGKAGVTALTTGVTGTSSMGSGMSEAYNEGATDTEATLYGAIKGVGDTGTELMFGGLGKTVNATGLSTGLSSADDMLAQKISSKISNQVAKNFVEYGIKAGAEGSEEVMAGIVSAIGKKVTYMKKEELSQIIEDENLLDQFIVGAVTSGIVQSGYVPGMTQGSLREANKTGRDFITGYTQNEQKVLDAEVQNRIAEKQKQGKVTAKEKAEIRKGVQNDLEKGYIDIDTIENTLGGETLKKYTSIVEQEDKLTKELEELGNQPNTVANAKKYEEVSAKLKELQEKSEKTTLKEQLSKEVSDMTVNDTFLRESYNEKGRRSQFFEADISKYDSKQQEIIQKAIDSKIFNNTNRTHEFVDMIAKISADKGVSFDFTDNQKLKESGFAKEGVSVNGYIKDGNITLNVNSSKVLNKVVGHEITHVLEGSDLYAELQKAVKEYATTKGEYKSKLEAITKLYEGVKGANVEQELTADLIGEYLFSDEAFVQQLSTQNRNIFQKIYDEIKYLVKTVTSGSKEAKQLEKVKKVFEKAYKQTTKDTGNESKTQFNISEDTELYQYIQDSLDGKLSKKSSYILSESISEKLAKDIENIVGFSVEGYENKISPGNIEHIRKEHGVDGRSDKSMSDLHDLAKINYVIENYDNLREGKRSKEYKNSDGSFAKTIELQKKIDDNFYYVVEAVPDAKAKSLHVVSAYINKNDTFSEVAVSQDPSRYVQDELQTNVSSDDSISQKQQNTTENQKFSLSEDNKGNTLSDKQVEYFKDSKVRDADGKLLEVYHGTKADFTEFDINKNKVITFGNGFYFGENQDTVNSYYAGENGKVMKTYLNIKNPFVIEQSQLKDIDSVPDVVMESLGIDSVTKDSIMQDLKKHGYDGIHYKNGIKGNDVYVAFEPSQIKSVDNKNPTENADINFSLSNNNDIAPTGNWNIKGSDIALDDSIPIRKDIAPAQNKEMQQSMKEGSTVPDEWNVPISDDLSEGPFSPPEGWEAGKTNNKKQASVEAEQTIKGRNAIKLEKYQKQLENTQTYRDKRISKNEELWTKREAEKREIEKSFDKKIAQKQKEYDAKKNKDTKEANKLLSQIHNLEAKRNERITECEKDIEHYMNEIEYVREESDRKITDLQEKIQKMNSAEFKTAEQRQTKQTEYRTLMSDLMGDTATWRDKKMGISYQTNTLRRNLRDIIRDADGNRDIARADAIYDELQGKYNHNEALLNREANKIKQVYADLKINKVEDVYIQMLGEYKYNPETTLTADVMKEYYEKHKKKIDQGKVDKAIELARKTYDSLFYRVNGVLKEQGFKEIGYREGYFPHFTEEKQSTLAKIFNWKTKDDSIPTDIAGLTEQFNPERSYQSFNKHRTGDDTDYSFMKGMDTYVQGALDWIYHIEDIQKRRAFENEIRYRHSEQGIKDKLDEIYKNEEYDADEIQEQIDMVLKEAKNPLNNFVTDFRNATNNLAGKKDSTDRSLEYSTNRKIYSTMTNLSNRVSANMVAGSVSSALTNFIPITQSWGQVSPISSLKAMASTIQSTIKDDGMIEKSDFMTNRLRTSENLYKTGWDITGEKVGLLMEGIDNFTTQTVWRSKYMENIQNGMTEDAAIKNADQFAENVMAGRSRGNMPTIFNSKNPVTKVFTAFQLEVNNQYGYMFKDMPQDIGKNATGKLIKGYATMFLGAYAYNALYSTLTGRDAAFDPIGIIEELLRDLGVFDDDEEKEPLDILGNLAENIVDELPFVGGLFGGGRVPISSAIPYDDPVSMVTGTAEDIEKGITEGDWKNLTNEWLKPLFYLGLPMGGGQARKTMQGLAMFDDDLPIAGSYTTSGKLRFSVDDTLLNRAQAAVFGQYASENAREYFDEGRSPLNEKKTQELADLDIPISEYWDIQDGLKEQEKLADKIDYVAGLDLPIAKKNILANNLTDRKDPIDLTDYALYGNLEELDFATSNPEKYTIAKAVGGYSSYKKYTQTLNDIIANKDKNGNAISGSRKTKIINYLNGLSADYGTKLILFKKEFPGDDTYNKEIVEYLNKRNDLSYSDIETILKELGFTVTSDGTVRW